MYELVNTSVPNGLVAGTHGFATVAMTKGLPDAIRTRLENFCAYPHRTSAHDASYYTQNPVNWFHLTLPTGEHVVGRTAPCEFDYTGRTNRISHLLCFPAKEMPLNGGTFVLKSEGARFAEPWQGEPRYLAADKTLVAQLQMADSQRGREPANWVNLFGEKGIEYAKRFAALLAQNLRGAGKSISFKAGAADIDGVRLLGLFSDLINLLPENLAAKATFATFAACVPNGVTCHLRGIFDRDRAFDAASALSPWVDCEAGVVRNENLLPPAESARTAAAAAAETSSANAVSETPRNATPTRNNYSQASFGVNAGYGARDVGGRGIVVAQKKSGFPWALVAIIGAFALLAAGGAAFGVWYYLDTQKQSAEKERKMKEAFEETSASSEIRALESELEQKTAKKQKEMEDKLRREAVKQAEEDAKKDKAREKVAQEKAKKDAEAKAAAEKEAKKKADEKKKADDAAKEKMALFEKPLSALSITEVIYVEGSSNPWYERKEVEVKKNVLTNESDLVFFYPANGHARRDVGRFLEKRNPFTKKSEWTPQIPSEAKTAPWCVVYVPTLQKVYWLWQGGEKRKNQKLFTVSNDTVNLADVCFDGVQDAATLYGKSQETEYVASWDDGTDGGKKEISLTSNTFNIERLKPDQTDLEDKEKKLEKNLSDTKKSLEQVENDLKSWENDYTNIVKKVDEFKNKQKEFNKKKDKDEKKVLFSIKETAYSFFEKYKDVFGGYLTKEPDMSKQKDKGKTQNEKIDVVQLGKLDAGIIKDKMNQKKTQWETDQKGYERQKENITKKLKSVKEEMSNWEKAVRNRLFTVEIRTKERN